MRVPSVLPAIRLGAAVTTQVSPEMWAALSQFLELAHKLGPSICEQARGVYEVVKRSPVVPRPAWSQFGWLCLDIIGPSARTLCISIGSVPELSGYARASFLRREAFPLPCLSESDLAWVVGRE